MKSLQLLVYLLLCHALVYSQEQRIYQGTTGNYSPSVYAKETSIAYGLHPRIVDELLDVFKAGADTNSEAAVEALLGKYKSLPQMEKADQELSAAALAELGIAEGSDLEKVMQWAVFTEGDNSPAVFALGNVDIWYGISPKAFRGIYETFTEKQGQALIQQGKLGDFERQLEDQIQRYKKLRSELALREDEMAQEANWLLDEGRIEDAIKVLENRYFFIKRKRERMQAQERQAEQSLDESIEQIKAEIEKEKTINGENSIALLKWYEKLGDGYFEKEQYKEAVEYYEQALKILTQQAEAQEEQKQALEQKLKKAIELKEKAMK